MLHQPFCIIGAANYRNNCRPDASRQQLMYNHVPLQQQLSYICLFQCLFVYFLHTVWYLFHAARFFYWRFTLFYLINVTISRKPRTTCRSNIMTAPSCIRCKRIAVLLKKFWDRPKEKSYEDVRIASWESFINGETCSNCRRLVEHFQSVVPDVVPLEWEIQLEPQGLFSPLSINLVSKTTVSVLSSHNFISFNGVIRID
jgi:hypothetical protein